ncbi:MAG: hypothetical protein C4523_02375 [Myxococcales bacterium]|nr:MAG: hypothetical protein C4523_02375 [Myxococcales bacterium]
MKHRSGFSTEYTYRIGGLTFGPYYRELTKAEQECIRTTLARENKTIRESYDFGHVSRTYRDWCEANGREPFLEYPEGHALVIGRCGISEINVFASAKGNPMDKWMQLCRGTPKRPAPPDQRE